MFNLLIAILVDLEINQRKPRIIKSNCNNNSICFNMRNMTKVIAYLSFFILIISFTISTEAKKVSKKNAEYTGKAIVEKDIMKDAGMWFMFMNQCEGTFAKAYKQKLGLLSWEDYKNFNKGNAKYQGGNYTVSKCDRETSTNQLPPSFICF